MIHVLFLNDTATTEIYTLSLHDALPISGRRRIEVAVEQADDRLQNRGADPVGAGAAQPRQRLAVSQDHGGRHHRGQDRKSTRLNSSHANISYAVFCLKKKKTISQFHYTS